MARLTNGLFGGFKGKIADVEGFNRNGVAFIRKQKRKSKVKPSLLRLGTMQNMTVVNRFIDTMTRFVRLGFSVVAKGQPFSANNAAKSYQLRHALQGQYPDVGINYAAVRLAEGKLLMPENLLAVMEGTGVRFSWDYHPVNNWDDRRSRAMVLAYIPQINKSYFFLMAACMNEMTQFLELPALFSSYPLHAYISFISEDQSRIGNSMHFELNT